MSIVEQRVTRSDEPYTALGLQLEHSRLRGRLDALVLADRQGIVVAYAGDASLCRALGAVAPLAPHAQKSCLAGLAGGGDVTVRAIHPLGHALFLAALGGTAARDAVMTSAAQGIARILAMN